MAKRERVLMIKETDNTTAKRLTRSYPNLIIFCEHTDEKQRTHNDIYKGNINYTSFADIDDDMNKFILHGNSVVLLKTDKRMLKFVEYETYLKNAVNGKKIDSNVYELSTSSASNYLELSSSLQYKRNVTHVSAIVGSDLIDVFKYNDNSLKIYPKKRYESGIGTAIIRISMDEDTFSYIVVKLTMNDDKNNMSLELDYKHIYLYVTQQKQLSAIVSPQMSRDKRVIFESSNPYVCSVDGNGIIRALNYGDSTITARLYAFPETYKTCIVTVEENEIVPNDQASVIISTVQSRISDGVNLVFDSITAERFQDYETMIHAESQQMADESHTIPAP